MRSCGWLVIALCGCSKSDPDFVVKTRIEAGVVHVEVKCKYDAEITLAKQTDHCAIDNTAQFQLLAAALGAGKGEIALAAATATTTKPLLHSVDIPSDAVRAGLLLDGCSGASSRKGEFEVSATAVVADSWGGTGTSNRFPLSCAFNPPRGGTVSVQVPPKSRLVVGGTTYEAPDSGAVEINLDFGVLLMDHPPYNISQLEKAALKIELPWRSEHAGTTAEGALHVSLPRPDLQARSWLEYLIEDDAIRPQFEPRADRPVVLLAPHHIRESHPGAKIKELAVIAVATEAGKLEHGECEYIKERDANRTDHGVQTYRLKRVLVEQKITAFDTATWKVIGSNKYVASGECPEFETINVNDPDAKVYSYPDYGEITRWVATLQDGAKALETSKPPAKPSPKQKPRRRR